MSLIRFEDVSLDFGDQKILDAASFAIETGERVCLIGRNGAGKSTTLKLISGEIEPDRGEVVYTDNLVISQLAQALPEAGDMSVSDMVRSGLGNAQSLLDDYSRRAANVSNDAEMQELEALHRQIDALGGWQIEQRVESTISELNLPAHKRMSELSGGWRRRVALARALVRKPDLLLLDEPTNHLDIVTIEWLEHVILGFQGAVLFITHDRAFLQKLATRIVEIDRTRLSSWPGDFANFQRRKEKALEDEAAENARFDKKLQQEEIWIRQGIKARRTRNEGRARALVAMRREREKRLTLDDNARMHIEEAESSGRKVIRARNLSYRYDEQVLLEDFSIQIMRGDRIGILGNNGVGKTTLLRLLLGKLEPQTGTVKHGTNLVVGYFDQLRESLEPEKSVAENVGEGRTYINLGGKDRHIIGYLKGFLFSPKRALTPVKALSGGERNRVILAKLFTRPANLLVLDEPTNDLDMETLEVLEDKLTQFAGTLLVVSHDRQFLDNVVTSTIVFEANGVVREHVGGYSDWLRQGQALAEMENPAQKAAERREEKREAQAASGAEKLKYHEQRELDALPETIEQLEKQIDALQLKVAAADFYAAGHEAAQPVLDELAEKQATLEQLIDRWSELEEKQQAWRESRGRTT
ncbi:ATP-binding cassette domain-containing protein [Woeseia oceani]|uniref:ATP-binding protein Uup n=1 Tax=Woeseia oceani TaxID=1548547 RepID=A0A193LHP7_9GAMM|nr:ATP-binding cassette domain-containing protein [Woeseia oceani]ANO52011.1 ABC transporter ATP-binding protein [Woeseia oceani]